MKRVAVVLFVLLTAGGLFAAPNKVALVYDGVSEVTRETYKFMRIRLGYQIDPIAVGAAFNAADYRGVIVLNVNVQRGMDPTLEKFVQSFTSKNKIIVVSLYSRSSSTAVTVTTAAQSTLGVDAVSAASAWSERRSGSDGILAMHEAWVAKVAALLAGL